MAFTAKKKHSRQAEAAVESIISSLDDHIYNGILTAARPTCPAAGRIGRQVGSGMPTGHATQKPRSGALPTLVFFN
jgi:hypothetical protein